MSIKNSDSNILTSLYYLPSDWVSSESKKTSSQSEASKITLVEEHSILILLS